MDEMWWSLVWHTVPYLHLSETAQGMRIPACSRRAVMLSCQQLCHHVRSTKSSQELRYREPQHQGILMWPWEWAMGSLLVSFSPKPTPPVSAGWWQMLVHEPHFTWAFTYAEGITPMGKKRQSSIGKLAKQLAGKANILSKKLGFMMDSWEELVSVIWLIKIRLWKNTTSAKWVLFTFQR